MSKIYTEVEVSFDAREIAKLFCEVGDLGFDIEFMKHYYQEENWGDTDIEELAEGMSEKSKSFFLKLAKNINEAKSK